MRDLVLRCANIAFIKRAPAFWNEFKLFRKKTELLADNRFEISASNIYPCMNDRTVATDFDRHYILHPAWAARIIKETNPEFHIDISSSLSFCTMLSAFIPVKFYDYRPAHLNLSNLDSQHGDLHNLPFADNSVSSLSCMHVIEHIGLGRYGEPIDPQGDLKAINELKRVLKKDGTLLFVTPVGKPKIMFNAHRIYSFSQIQSYFKELELVGFSLVPDDPKVAGLITNATQEMSDKQEYGCGCFWFKKK
ncbi:DUF268 domain-containing protein [Adhaeribacter swui]|uniref:DUF268 domain-containing protein n=1 Tax=Adhaeribacter swui TaxID=2086471 RepID=A0A7G7GCV1_9BACT|nr:DUF268 domain-containing protein [Adhaeribacter swui]QNF34985.1 DUF268 domain-containing protein [Adhaeribacter swui]